jgi:peroxiredoxin Q/BCP
MKSFAVLLLSIVFAIQSQSQETLDFTLQSVTDNSTFTLSKSKGKLIALHFLLKTECPYCIKHTNEYFEKAGSLPNVIQVFIKPDNEKEINEWAEKLKGKDEIKYPIYQDKNAAVADLYKIPNGYFFHGQTVHYPALILLNENGQEIFRYVGKNNADRFSFESLTRKINELNR